jgi:hypothetical protein
MPKTRRRRVYTKNEYLSGDGMLTAVWGPSLWHYLHAMSFNYPNHPSPNDKRHYRDFVLGLRHVLPCKHCRINLEKNLKVLPLGLENMSNRTSFSRYIYNLHELVNNMLGKRSGLTYCDVRERYEHFRSRCTDQTKDKIERGCTESLYGNKAKCVIHIVPQERKCETIQIDKRCVKTRTSKPRSRQKSKTKKN